MVTGGLLLLLGLLGAAGLSSTIFLYLKREPVVPERPLLLALRVAALILLLSLLLDPSLPGEDPATAARRGAASWTLVDADPALLARNEAGRVYWEELLDRAEARSAGGDRLARVEGDRPAGVDLVWLRNSAPDDLPGDPATALLRLAELGADSLLLLSPLRRPLGPLEDALARLPVPVRVERVGGTVRNAALAELDLPVRGEPGEAVEGSVLLAGEGGEAGDSVAVEVWLGDEISFREVRALPATGAPTRLPFSLALPPDTGSIRVEARVSLEGDRFPADDVRVRVMKVGGREGGVVLISLRPDWEPRTLLPVLERATGFEGEGFLRVGADRFLPLVAGDSPLTPTSLDQVLARARIAALLVLHGAEGEIDGRVAELVTTHPRVIHLPHGLSGARLAGVSTGNPLPGEGMVVSELPVSPLSPYLSGRSLSGLSPLSRVLPPAEVPSGISALELQMSRGVGEVLPAFLLREEDAGRRGVALASDFWRWGVREGEAREVYLSLWAGVAGWLLALERVAGEDRIRPERSVLERGRRQPWEGSGYEGQAVEVVFRSFDGDPDGPILRRDSARVDELGRFTLPDLPPGRYRWRARGEDGLATAGEVEVEAFLDALLRPPGDPDRLHARAGTGVEPALAMSSRRPLRSHPLPWVLLVGMLCVEWALRRRAGLR